MGGRPVADTKERGCLIIGANSIGNPLDIPLRCLEAVRTADLLIFEEDRPARQVLKQAGVHRDYLRYTEHREILAEEELTACLKAGKTALYMSDQGVPGLADPGQGLIAIALALQARLVMIPGPSSVTAALAACPFAIAQFHFAGFLPREQALRRARLKTLSELRCPIVLMDTPYRLRQVLDDCLAELPKSRLFLALDISGPEERYETGSPKALIGRSGDWPPKLNFVLIIDKA